MAYLVTARKNYAQSLIDANLEDRKWNRSDQAENTICQEKAIGKCNRTENAIGQGKRAMVYLVCTGKEGLYSKLKQFLITKNTVS